MKWLLLFPLLFSSFGFSDQCSSENLLSGIAPSSSPYLYRPEKLSDGAVLQEGMFWNSKEATILLLASEPLVFDLGQNRSVAQVVMQADNNEDFIVEASLDQKQWSQVGVVPQGKDTGMRTRRFDFPPITARYLRFLVGKTDGYVTISEIGVFCGPQNNWKSYKVLNQTDFWESKPEFRSGWGETTPFLAYSALFIFLCLWAILQRRSKSKLPLFSFTKWQELIPDSWCSLDRRSLGAFRVCLAALLIYDTATRIGYYPLFFAKSGWLPPFQTASDQSAWFPWGVLQWIDSDLGNAWLLGAALISHVLFFLGLLTPVMHLFSAIFLCLIHARVLALNHGGHMVLRLLTIWSLFLPLGDRFSIDFMKRKDVPLDNGYRSRLIFPLMLQFAIIYSFNVFSKFSQDWKNGDFSLLVLQVGALITPLGVWTSSWLPPTVGKIATYATIWIEALAPFLLFYPFRPRLCRRLLFIMLGTLHLSFALLMYVREFSAAMFCFLFLFFPWKDAEIVFGGISRHLKIRKAFAKCTPYYPTLLLNALGKTQKALVAFVVLFAVSCFSHFLRVNYPISQWVAPVGPSLLNAITLSTQTFQDWCRFGSCTSVSYPQGSDDILTVAETIDGKQFDPVCRAMIGSSCEIKHGLIPPFPKISCEAWASYARYLWQGDPNLLKSLRYWLERKRLENQQSGLGDFKYTVYWLRQPITDTHYPNTNPFYRIKILSSQ